MNLDYILVGHLLGAVDLGLYLLAFNLSSWPANIVSVAVRRVSLAGFSRLAERPAALGESFARAVAIVLAVALPMSAVLASFAHPLIDVVYGSKWLPAAKVLGLLCVLGAVRVATELAYDFLVALGRTRPNLWLQLLWAGCLVPALYFGAERWGIVGVAGGHACVALIVMVPAFIMVLRRSGVSASLLGTRCARPIAGTVLIVGSALLVRFLVHDSLLELVLGLPLAGLLYLVTVLPMRSLLTTSDLLTAEPSVEETSLSAP
jgi:O-antigen/teichoic acid export membrane protein